MTRIALLTVLALLALTAPAFAEAVEEKKGDLGPVIFGPALLLLLALPLAVVVRALHRAPTKIAESVRGPGHVARVLGLANIVLILLVLSGAKGSKVLGVIAVLLLLAFAIAAFFGLSAAAVNLGRKLFADEARGASVGAFALAWLLLAGLSLVPVLGSLYLLWWVTWGVGATLFALFGGGEAEPAAEGSAEEE
jgi:hypothetical protein